MVLCAWLASKLTRPEHRESMRYCQEENERHQTQQCRWAEGHCQRNLGFIPPQQCHKLIPSMPRRTEPVIKAKEPLPSIEYIYSKWTYFPEGQQFTKNICFIGLMKYSNVLRCTCIWDAWLHSGLNCIGFRFPDVEEEWKTRSWDEPALSLSVSISAWVF